MPATHSPQLDAKKIVTTIERLDARIRERFPQAGLTQVNHTLLETAQQAHIRAEWIARPIYGLRILSYLLIALILALSVGLTSVIVIRLVSQESEVGNFIQIAESGMNEFFLIGATVFFLFTLEARIKRRRALQAIHELRSIAHIIDMHQLTKDPERTLESAPDLRTAASPKAELSPFELRRYLDYCSEMLSLTGKIAALYVQRFDDAAVLASVNEVETLVTGLSRKIWQKIMILHSLTQESAQEAEPASPEEEAGH